MREEASADQASVLRYARSKSEHMIRAASNRGCQRGGKRLVERERPERGEGRYHSEQVRVTEQRKKKC